MAAVGSRHVPQNLAIWVGFHRSQTFSLYPTSRVSGPDMVRESA